MADEPRRPGRKPYVVSKTHEKWTEEERQRFVEALQLFPKDWKRIESYIGSKTINQIRSHAQKYFLKNPDAAFAAKSAPSSGSLSSSSSSSSSSSLSHDAAAPSASQEAQIEASEIPACAKDPAQFLEWLGSSEAFLNSLLSVEAEKQQEQRDQAQHEHDKQQLSEQVLFQQRLQQQAPPPASGQRPSDAVEASRAARGQPSRGKTTSQRRPRDLAPRVAYPPTILPHFVHQPDAAAPPSFASLLTGASSPSLSNSGASSTRPATAASSSSSTLAGSAASSVSQFSAPLSFAAGGAPALPLSLPDDTQLLCHDDSDFLASLSASPDKRAQVMSATDIATTFAALQQQQVLQRQPNSTAVEPMPGDHRLHPVLVVDPPLGQPAMYTYPGYHHQQHNSQLAALAVQQRLMRIHAFLGRMFSPTSDRAQLLDELQSFSEHEAMEITHFISNLIQSFNCHSEHLAHFQEISAELRLRRSAASPPPPPAPAHLPPPPPHSPIIDVESTDPQSADGSGSPFDLLPIC